VIVTEPVDTAPEVEVADFDAFFAEQGPEQRTGVPLRLFGREYVLPPSLPALFTLQLHRVQHSARPEDIRAMLGALFGPEACDHWTEHGMTDRQLGIVLLWATANTAEAGTVSMDRAAELYDKREAAKQAEAAQQGKARTAPRKASKGKGKPRSSGPRS
jgi:hypothetical protein